MAEETKVEKEVTEEVEENKEAEAEVVEEEKVDQEVANFLKGYEMIYKQIMTLLENQGVKVIEAEGKEFDPNFHQAVMTVSDENFKPGMVVEELQKGYMLKDRVIRASLVKVSE